MFLITGATGHFGGKALRTLLAKVPAEQVAISVRSPDKANDLKARGVDVRHGDFDDPGSLDAAFAKVERLLLVSTDDGIEDRIRQHLTAVAAARQAGVTFIAYTSIAKADSTPLVFGKVHRATESAIRASGIPYAFLRNNWYIENEIEAIKATLAGAPVVTSAKDGSVGWAARDDYAEAAANVLASEGHADTIYELAGSPITYDELAGVVSAVLGRAVPVRHVDDATFRTIMLDIGLPGSVADLLAGIHASIRQGALDVESDDLATLLGRPPTPLSEVVKTIVSRAPRSSITVRPRNEEVQQGRIEQSGLTE